MICSSLLVFCQHNEQWHAFTHKLWVKACFFVISTQKFKNIFKKKETFFQKALFFPETIWYNKNGESHLHTCAAAARGEANAAWNFRFIFFSVLGRQERKSQSGFCGVLHIVDRCRKAGQIYACKRKSTPNFIRKGRDSPPVVLESNGKDLWAGWQETQRRSFHQRHEKCGATHSFRRHSRRR